MAQSPFVTSSRTPVPQQIKPEYKMIVDLSGGLNTNKPPDQLDDRESPDMLNLVYLNKVLCVDFGFTKLGGRVQGIPQQTIEFVMPQTGVKYQILVTTRTVYKYSALTSDWEPIPSNITANPDTSALITGTGANPTVHFSPNVATWVVGQRVAMEMDNGVFFAGPALGTTSPMVVNNTLPAGRTIANGTEVFPLPNLSSDGSLQISWVVDPHAGWLIFTNGTDPVQRFDGITCEALPGLSGVGIDSARHVARYHGITVLGYTVESGVTYPYRIRRSATNDSTIWSILDAGFDDLIDTGDPITDILVINPHLAIMRENSIVRASYYGIGAQVLWYDYGLSSTGTIGNQASVATKTAAVVVTEPGVFIYAGDYGLTDIGDKIFNSFLSYSGDLAFGAPTRLSLFCLYVPILDETWLFYAGMGETWPTKILRYNHKTNAWFKRQISGTLSFAGAGLFSQPASTRWVDLVGSRWIDRHKPWVARANQANYHGIALCGSANNQVYLYDFNKTTTDDGRVIAWYYTSKDYPLPDEWKTLDGVVFYGKGIVDLVELSTDYGISWHQLSSAPINLGPTWNRGNLDCSLTTAFVRIRFSGQDPSFKLSWFAFKTLTASEQ